MAADKIRPAALKIGIRLETGQRFGCHNFRHSLATFLVSRGKDVKTIQGLLRHAKVTTTLDLYSQSIDAAKLQAKKTSHWRSKALQSRLISPTTAPASHCEAFRCTIFGVTAPFLTSHREEK